MLTRAEIPNTTRIVDEGGVVVEVDAALHIVGIGDVVHERGDFERTVGLGVADAETTLDLVVRIEFRAFVDEQVGLALICPVGEGEDLAAIADRNAIACGDIGDPFGSVEERACQATSARVLPDRTTVRSVTVHWPQIADRQRIVLGSWCCSSVTPAVIRKSGVTWNAPKVSGRNRSRGPARHLTSCTRLSAPPTAVNCGSSMV